MTRSRDALIGVLYILLVASLIALSIAIYNRDFASVVKVSVRTDNIGSSLQKGSDVEVRGILVGTVTGVTTDGNGAKISVAIDKSRAKDLPSDVTAQLLPKTLFGERYVSLVLPATPGGPSLHSGQIIRQDTSAQGIEVQDVFNHLLPVLQAVQPAELSELLGELAQGLQGKGVEFGNAVTAFSSYLTEFAPKVPEFAADIAAFGRVADTYTAASPDLLSALNDFTTTSETVVAQQQQLLATFENVAASSNTVGGVVGTNEDNIIRLSAGSIPTLQVLARYSPEFPCVAQALTDFVPTANSAFGAGTSRPGLRVTLQIVPSLGSYLPGQRASTSASGPPSCPYLASGSPLAGTALGGPAAKTGSAEASAKDAARYGLPTSTTASADDQGIGTANSPAENQLIAELVAPTVGMSPAAFPAWGSLLLGPVLRGTSVTVR